ncbi:MAG: 3-oxoacyl-[acyl-carrier protein] reductase [Bermanella sp.]|jgi:3-oxoacyl-[acyl-carrier protein] reductase
MDLGLAEKVVMVAGSSRGLGKAIAQAVHGEGAKLSLSSSDTKAIAQVGNSLPGSLAMLCNVRDPLQIQNWVDATIAEFGGIDSLVVNAGGPPPGTFGDFADEDWQAAFELTLLSAVRLVRAALPALKKSKGSILFMTSSSVKEPIDFLLLSNVMRSGVASLSKSLSRSLAADGLRVNTIVPGIVETDRIKTLVANQAGATGIDEAAQRKAMEAVVPMGRFGRPEEFARVAAFLLSPAASYINGETVTVDGGTMKTLF